MKVGWLYGYNDYLLKRLAEAEGNVVARVMEACRVKDEEYRVALSMIHEQHALAMRDIRERLEVADREFKRIQAEKEAWRLAATHWRLT